MDGYREEGPGRAAANGQCTNFILFDVALYIFFISPERLLASAIQTSKIYSDNNFSMMLNGVTDRRESGSLLELSHSDKNAISNSSVFKIRLYELNSSADRHWYDSEFHTEGALTLKAFAENANAIRGTGSNSLSDDRNVRAGR